MFKKIIKAALKIAAISTGISFLTGSFVKGMFVKKFFTYTALLGLNAITAKGTNNTSGKNLGLKAATTNPVAPRNVVYGKTRVGGTIVHRAVSGANNNKLHNVIAIAAHEINAIKKLYIDGGKGVVELDFSSDFATATENGATVYRVTNSAFTNTDNDASYTGGSLIKLVVEKGEQTTSNGYAVAQMAEWTTDHKLQGIAYVYINCIFDTEKFASYPSFSFEVEGKKVYDPVTTTTAYSTNPSLIIRDYLMDATYGFGATSDEINDAATGAGFVKARSDCNDDVSITSGTEDRYTLNGQFDMSEEPQQVLQHMLSACAGQLIYNNGKFSLFVGKERTASGTITDDKLLAPIQITTKASGQDLANGVKATYVRPADRYIAAEITPYKDSTYLSADTPSGEQSANYENFIDVTFPYTQSTFTAQRLARIALDYQRQDQTLQVIVPIEFMTHQVGDIVNFTNTRLGYDGKDFEIVAMDFEFMADDYLALRLNLKEYSATVFNNISYVADPTLPSPPNAGDNTVATPTGLTLTESSKNTTAKEIYVRAVWTNANDDKIDWTEVAYKKSTDTEFDAAIVGYPRKSFSFRAESATTYNIKVRHGSNNGVHGDYTGVVNITTSADVGTFTTGSIAGITVESDKLYEGTGTFNNSNTGFYLDNTGQFSLKDKLSFNGTTLNISGNLTVENTISANKIVVDGINLDNLISASTQAGSIYLTEFTGIKIATAGGTSGYPPLLRLQDDQGTNTFTDITQSQTGINIRARANTAKGTITFQGIGSGITPSTYASFDASGDMAFNNNVTISGDLTVSGTTTTINTTNLDVADKNITLNFGAGDTSSNANGAGITIQDAVDASTDATLLWDSTNDKFDFSHSIQVPDNANVKVGSAGDLFMVHNGSNSFIQNKVGDFYIENASDDKDIFFRSDDGSGGLATYMTIDGSHSRMTIAKNTLLFDNVELRIGDNSGAGDLKIYHNGTDSYIQNHTGSLNIENLSDDKDIYFKSDDGSGGLTTYFFLDGSDSTTRFTVNPLKFNDNIKALFGTGSDLEIFHNGTNSVINDSGTGDLIFQIAGSEKGRITSTAFSFQGGYSATGSFNTTLGAYQINGTTVIDSSRNLTNIANADFTAKQFNEVLRPQYNSSLTNTRLINVNTSNSGDYIANVPFGDAWHDIFAFRRFYTWNYETSTDGVNFTSATINENIFDHKDSTQYKPLDGTVKAVRWTVTGVQHSLIRYISLSQGFTSSTPQTSMTVESGDGTTFSTFHATTTFSGSQKVHYFATDTSLNNNVLRITLKKTDISNNNEVDIHRLCAWSARAGDQGKGKEFHYPFDYTLRDEIKLIDNQKLILGQSDDLQIYHNGSNSYIDDAGTGNLFIRSNEIRLNKYTGEFMIRAIADGAVTLYHNNSAKLATTSSGIDVTGSMTATSLSVSSAFSTTANINISGTSGKYQINSLDVIEYSGGFRVGSVADDDESLTLVGFGGQPNIVLDDSVIQFKFSTSEKMRLDNSGRLGIGTSSPDNVLHVKHATTNVVGKFESGDNQVWINLNDDGGGTYGALLGHDSDAGHLFAIADNSVTKRLVIDDSGRVGIGTSSPNKLLHLSSADPTIMLTDTDTNADSRISANSSAGSLFFDADLNNESAFSTMSFRVDGTEALRIDSSQRVGIGTNSPQVTFHANSGATDEVARFESTDQFADIQLKDSGGASHIRASNGSLILEADRANAVSSSAFLINVDNSEALRIDSSGRVGIGTTSPATKLEVAGNTVLTGDTRIGSSTVSGTHALKVYHTDNFEAAKFVTNQGGSLARFTDSTNSIEVGNQNGEAVLRTGSTIRLAANTSGNVRVATGALQMGTTTVIDSSRNLTNIGTISSGAITTSGLLTVGSGAGAIKINESFVTARSSDNANDINLIANINVFDADDVVIGSTSGQRFNDNIVFRTNGAQALRLDSSQNATFASNIEGSLIKATDQFQSISGSRTLVMNANFSGLGAIGMSSNDHLTFVTNNTERMRLDNAGSLAVGNTSPSSFWGQANKLVLDASGNTGMTIKSTSSGNGRIVFTDTTSSTAGLNDGGQIHYGHSADDMRFRTAGADRVTINATGVGIGTTSPIANLQVGDGTGSETLLLLGSNSNTTSSQILFGDNTSGADPFEFGMGIRYDSANNVLHFDDNYNDGGSANNAIMTIDRDDQRVGIGTTSPSSTLDVRGITTIQTDGGNEQLVIKRASNTNEQLILGFHSSDYGTIQAVEQGVAFRNLALNPNGGNVCIGTTTGEKLTVAGSIKSTARAITTSSTAGVTLSYDSSNSIAKLETWTSKPFSIETAGVERLRVTNDGKIGIGTTSVTNALGWGSIAQIGGANPALSLRNSSSNQWDIANFGGTFNIYNGANSRFQIDSSGNTTVTGTEFRLGSSSVISRIRTINASGFTETAFDNFSSGAYQERMRISSSGSVGIAKTNPSSSYKLDVNGKIRSQQEILINTGSLFINEEGEGIHIVSANGTEYKLTVSNAGALVITEV